LIFKTVSHIGRRSRSGWSQASGSALDFQDGISHRAAKPEWMSQVSGSALDFQDGLSHRAAKPE
jgi:hypothetical protein